VYEDLVSSRLSAGGSVLDLGCGRGGVLERLHSRARLVVGLDPDLRSLREHRVTDFSLAAGAGVALPFADETFDVVVCSWVLEHLRDPERTLAETARVLHRGGSFVFLTPNLCHPLVALNWMLGSVQGQLAARMYDRSEADTFPVFYRANTGLRIDRLAQNAGLAKRSLQFVGDPTYVAFAPQLFWLGRLLERATLRPFRVHLVGEYVAA
jgi:SAM-dependent methyltransferase